MQEGFYCGVWAPLGNAHYGLSRPQKDEAQARRLAIAALNKARAGGCAYLLVREGNYAKLYLASMTDHKSGRRVGNPDWQFRTPAAIAPRARAGSAEAQGSRVRS